MKTRIPLNFYFIITSTLSFLILILPSSLLATIFYEVFIFLYLYIFLGRDACRIELNDIELKIKYVFFWQKNITIEIKDIVEVDYEKGFYDFFSKKTRGGLFVFPQYCSDRLILKTKDNDCIKDVFININTRIFQFDKMFKLLKEKIGAKSIHSSNRS